MKVNNSIYTIHNNNGANTNNTLNIVDSKVDQRINKEIQSNVKEIGAAQWDRYRLWSNEMTANINAQFSVSKGFFSDPSLNYNKKMQCFEESQIAYQNINSYRSEIYNNLNKARTDVLSLKYYRSSIFESRLGGSVEENAIAIRIEQNSKITDENEKLFLKIDEEITAYRVRIKDITTKDYLIIKKDTAVISSNDTINIIATLTLDSDIQIVVQELPQEINTAVISSNDTINIIATLTLDSDIQIVVQELPQEINTAIISSNDTINTIPILTLDSDIQIVVQELPQEINTAIISSNDNNTNVVPIIVIGNDVGIIIQEVYQVALQENIQELPVKEEIISIHVEDRLINKENGFQFDSGIDRDNLNNLDKELFDLIGRIGTELNIDANDHKNIQVIKDKSFNIAKTIHQNIIDYKLLSNEQLKKMDRVGFTLHSQNDTWGRWLNDNIHDTDIESYKGEISKYLRFINTAYFNGTDGISSDGGIQENVGAIFYGSSITDRTVGVSLLKLKEQYGLINSEAALNILKSLIINQIKQRTPNISDGQIKLNATLPQYRTDDLYAAYRGINQSKLDLDYIDKVEGRINTKEAMAYLLKSFTDVNEIKTLRSNNNLSTNSDKLFSDQKDNIHDLVKRLGHVQRAGNRNNIDITVDKDDQMPDRGVCAHGTFNQIVEVGNFKHKDIRIISEAKTLFDDKWNQITNKYWNEVPEEQKEHLQNLFEENVDIKIHKTDQAYYVKNNSTNIDRSYNEFIMNIIRDMDADFNFFNSKSPHYLGIKINALETNINNLQYQNLYNQHYFSNIKNYN